MQDNLPAKHIYILDTHPTFVNMQVEEKAKTNPS